MLDLPGAIYDRYDRVVKSCKTCSTSVPLPPRARIAGLHASSFGDLIVVDHAEINYRMNSFQCCSSLTAQRIFLGYGLDAVGAVD